MSPYTLLLDSFSSPREVDLLGSHTDMGLGRLGLTIGIHTPQSTTPHPTPQGRATTHDPHGIVRAKSVVFISQQPRAGF